VIFLNVDPWVIEFRALYFMFAHHIFSFCVEMKLYCCIFRKFLKQLGLAAGLIVPFYLFVTYLSDLACQ
jgi:hypothetical protein